MKHIKKKKKDEIWVSYEVIDKSIIKAIKITWTDYILHTYKEKSLITQQAEYVLSIAGSNSPSWLVKDTNFALETVLAISMYHGRLRCFVSLCNCTNFVQKDLMPTASGGCSINTSVTHGIRQYSESEILLACYVYSWNCL